jgi:3-hydroxyacyl-[acyl-carrier-protein] dehydratase
LSHPKKFSHEEICAILPQQPPFLFLDEAAIDGKEITASYRVRGDEFALRGHFKNDAVMPGSLIFEAMGQAGCLAILSACGPMPTSQLLFVMMDGARCFKRVTPGHRLDMNVTQMQLRKPLATFSGKAFVNGERVAEVEKFMLAFGVEVP